MNKKYKNRVGSPIQNNDVQEVGEFIEDIEERTPINILNKIKRNKKHPIYNYITWDDSEASNLYRLQEVKNIVNHIVLDITISNPEVPVRAFVSVVEDDKRVYIDTDTVFKTPEYKDQILNRAKMELNNWIIRNNQYEELAGIIKPLKILINKFNK